MDIEKKIFAIGELEVKKDDGKLYLTGYANTKNTPDAYGDVPTNFKGKKVYDLKRMKTNPVMLVDHINSATKVMGNFTMLREDDHGLKFKALLRNPDDIAQPDLKDVINGYKDGFIGALSIGGQWKFEDGDNPTHLTKAIIHEISGVGIGADANALTQVDKPKSLPVDENIVKGSKLETITSLIGDYRKSDDPEIIKKIKEVF